MASIVDLVRPKADFDPETIAVLCAALDEAWDRLLQSGSECTRPAYARAMREVVARRIIDMAQQGIRDQKELANGALRFLAANFDLSANAGKILREWLSRRWRFPRLRLPTAEKACRPRKILVVYRKCRTVERISTAPYRFGIDRPTPARNSPSPMVIRDEKEIAPGD